MTDKETIRQVLGDLMQHPQFLSEIDKYNLTVSDFSSRLERYIFGAIDGISKQGSTHIEPIDVANYLESNPVALTSFNNQNGIEYLQDAIAFSQTENFNYYYNRLKKLNLLRDLKKQGFAVDKFYCEDLTRDDADKINQAFESLTTTDICNAIRGKLLKLETNYSKNEEVKVEGANVDIFNFIETMNDKVEIGVPIQGRLYNSIISGAQKGTLTIRSGCSGLGKTRQAVGDACRLAYPIHYDTQTRQWVKEGQCEKVLFIITEQTIPQIKKMILAYLTDINEDKFKYGSFSNEELDLLSKAAQIIDTYKDNFIIIKMPNPTIELVKTMVRETCLLYSIDHVFYDYIFIGPSLLGEFKGFSLRNDELLLMFATALKDLAVELDVSMFTSTQVNASADDNENIRNEASLAGGRATINKADNGAIMARPTQGELDVLRRVIEEHGWDRPNCVTDIFKVRSGKYTQVRVWSSVDLGRMKKTDLFVTDAQLNVIDIENSEYQVDKVDWESDEWAKTKKLLDACNKVR